jgi:hypothetical protein
MQPLPKEIIEKIRTNISRNNLSDKKKFGRKGTLTYEEFMNKLEEQGNKCYVCLQEFKYDGKQWCYFFPSADRIYNYSPHTYENIAISCFFCNVRMFKQISEKKCGLCEGLNHHYVGDIITKSTLFRNLGNNNSRIKEYIINNTKNITTHDKILYYDSDVIKEYNFPKVSSPNISSLFINTNTDDKFDKDKTILEENIVKQDTKSIYLVTFS